MEMTKSSNDLLRVPNPFQKEDEFPDFLRLYLALFPDPCDMLILIFSRLLRPYMDSFPSAFCFNPFSPILFSDCGKNESTKAFSAILV